MQFCAKNKLKSWHLCFCHGYVDVYPIWKVIFADWIIFCFHKSLFNQKNKIKKSEFFIIVFFSNLNLHISFINVWFYFSSDKERKLRIFCNTRTIYIVKIYTWLYLLYILNKFGKWGMDANQTFTHSSKLPIEDTNMLHDFKMFHAQLIVSYFIWHFWQMLPIYMYCHNILQIISFQWNE